MFISPRNFSILSALLITTFLGAPVARADALRVNGVCELNNCSTVPLTPANSSSSTLFDFTFTFANSDSYRVQGTIFEGQSSSSSSFYDEIGPSDFIVTYLGNATHTASSADVLSSEFLGRYPSEPGGPGYFESELRGVFGSGLGFASSASADFTVDGHLVSSLGPILSRPGSFDITDSGAATIRSGIQTLDYDYTLTFGEGSEPGSSIELYPSTPPPVPEPSSLVLLGTGMIGLGGMLQRRLRYR